MRRVPIRGGKAAAIAALVVVMAAAPPSRRSAGAAPPLDRFPIVVRCGVAVPPAGRSGGEDGDGGDAGDAGAAPLVLPDRPFRPSRGYGYTGGAARSLARAALAGERGGGPVAWREDPRRYSFRLPNGRYAVELSFIETETAAPGQRRIDIDAEERPLVADLDIASEVGDFRRLAFERVVDVRDGWLDVDLRRSRAAGSARQLPPRISSIRITPVAGELPLAPPAPRVHVERGYLAHTIRWDPVRSAGVVGYGVFRAEDPAGPYEPLSAYTVLGTEFVDRSVIRGASYSYRVRAYGALGGQSRLSDPVEVTARLRLPAGTKVFSIDVPQESAAALLTRSTAARPVEGHLSFLGRTNRALVSAETSPLQWQLRKSFHVRLRGGRPIDGRRRLAFLGETGDPTLLREILFHRAAAALGLAAPRVEPVHLLVEGRHAGIHISREVIDSRFLARSRLDRRGVLVRADLRGDLPLTWEPYGEQVGRGGGGVSKLTLFFHELLRVGDDEIERWFEERFPLDRLVTRLALAAVTGRRHGALQERLYLQDSRNGKWEVLPDRAPDGAFGIAAFDLGMPEGAAARARDPRDVAWSLDGPSLARASLPLPDWQILETRFFNRPALRARYLDRIERIYREELDEAAFDALVDEQFRIVSAAVGEDRGTLWPFDGGAAFDAGPAAIKAAFRAHRDALLEAIAAERARAAAGGEPLVLSEILLRPAAAGGAPTTAGSLPPARAMSLDGAWIEIWNRSRRAVSLRSYRLSTDPRRPGAWSLPAVSLGAGERRRIILGSGGGSFLAPLRPSPDGGVLVLSRVDERGRAHAADLLFYGHQTAGFACARLAGGRWVFTSRPTPGEPPVEDVEDGSDGKDGQDGKDRTGESGLRPPSWRFRWAIELGRDRLLERTDELTLILKPGSKVKEAFACVREPGNPDFTVLPMEWNERLFRWERRLDGLDWQSRWPFYFLVRAANGLERTYPLTGSDLTFFTPTRPRVFINEVLPRPSRTGEFDEFIELYNAEDMPVSVDGMFLTDHRRNTVRWRLRPGKPIPPKGFLVLHAGGGGGGTHAPFKLSNSGEYLGLYHRYEEGNILVDHMTFAALPVDQSWGRREDGKKGFRRWKDPTPGKRNLPKIPEEYLRKKKGKDGAGG